LSSLAFGEVLYASVLVLMIIFEMGLEREKGLEEKRTTKSKEWMRFSRIHHESIITINYYLSIIESSFRCGIIVIQSIPFLTKPNQRQCIIPSFLIAHNKLSRAPTYIPASLLIATLFNVLPSPLTPLPFSSCFSPLPAANSVNTLPRSFVGLIIFA